MTRIEDPGTQPAPDKASHLTIKRLREISRGSRTTEEFVSKVIAELEEASDVSPSMV